MTSLNKTILIVEDEAELLHILEQGFKAAGFNVITARSGEEGIKFVEQKPDVILVDVVMPKMDGLTMLKKIRQNKEHQKIPAIVLSNLSDPQTTADALDAGAFDHLVKTEWEIPDLVNRVKEKIGVK